MNRTRHRILLALAVVAAAARVAPAQEGPPGARETLQLGVLQRQALAADPRAGAPALFDAQSGLRARTIANERLPEFTVDGQAQYQSDVPRFGLSQPGGAGPVGPPHDTYDASLRAEQRLFDATIGPRVAVERAQSAEAQARVGATTFALRQQVSDAFFSAALADTRLDAVAAALADLEARLREATARVREGVALAGEAAAVEASLLQRRQDQAELRAIRRAALARLALLTTRPIDEDAVLALPDLASTVAAARERLSSVRARPEYDVFARARERLARQADVVSAAERPRLSAFGRVGVGRPGLNFIGEGWDSYWVSGIRVQWKAWAWGASAGERAALAIQQQLVAADEAAFTAEIQRAIQNDAATIDRLQATLADDDRIIALREAIDRGAEARFRENVMTAADYLGRATELLDARIRRAAHRVELAQASARLLNTLGIEAP